MARYANQTTVPVERSRSEIEEVLRRYHAQEFHSGWDYEKAIIAFRLNDLFIRFNLPFPKRDDRKFTHKKDGRTGGIKKVSEDEAAKRWDQDVRSRWRALLLVVKAKLEAIEIGISTVEHEFLAFVVMPNAVTIGEWMTSQLLPAIKSGEMPKMLTVVPDDKVIDAEFSEKEKQ